MSRKTRAIEGVFRTRNERGSLLVFQVIVNTIRQSWNFLAGVAPRSLRQMHLLSSHYGVYDATIREELTGKQLDGST